MRKIDGPVVQHFGFHVFPLIQSSSPLTTLSITIAEHLCFLLTVLRPFFHDSRHIAAKRR